MVAVIHKFSGTKTLVHYLNLGRLTRGTTAEFVLRMVGVDVHVYEISSVFFDKVTEISEIKKIKDGDGDSFYNNDIFTGNFELPHGFFDLRIRLEVVNGVHTLVLLEKLHQYDREK